MAAVSCGPKGQLALLVDEASQQRFLVDSGSSYSKLPHKSQQPHSGPCLCTADHSPIPCWGGCKVHVTAGGRRFLWTFLLADVVLPIIGAVTDTHQLYEQTLPWARIDPASLGLREKRLDLSPREVRYS